MSVTDADKALASDWNIECWHCSEYEGDFEADLAEAFAAHREQAHAEGYEAAVRDVVAWLREAIGDHFADLAEREFKP